MGLTFYQLKNNQEDLQYISRGVPLIPKWMNFPRTEDPSWACTFAMPDRNGILEEDLPRDKEDGSCVVIPCFYYQENLPKLLNIGWSVSVSEPQSMSDGVKAALGYDFPKSIRALIFFLNKGGDTLKILPLPSISGGH